MKDNLVIIKGAGDIATGVAVRLFNSGFKVLTTEVKKPSAIRRKVSFSEAVYDGEAVVEQVSGVLLHEPDLHVLESCVGVLVDPDLSVLECLSPVAVVDACLAKKNTGLNKDMAGIVIALGPGFDAGVDCDAVVETMRGHDLGRIYYSGKACADTGVPGLIAGVSGLRVIYSSCSGVLKVVNDIGTVVNKGDVLAFVGNEPVVSPIAGVVRGMIRDGFVVSDSLKIADVDPRFKEVKNCYTISDKARAVGGSVLEAIMCLKGKK
jgi:xanthine dehydrogenase accessory factor